ncbi:proline-rich receptor-like protein kinase PERK1 [Tasmannia lanceolata]|uniref:proline-rich receptor-like protein kinase PERK1 n=1 Tax=Tasmannia lanceolata TaxID=3420 RepID=UPI004063B0FA
MSTVICCRCRRRLVGPPFVSSILCIYCGAITPIIPHLNNAPLRPFQVPIPNRHPRQNRGNQRPSPSGNPLNVCNVRMFNYQELAMATNGFSSRNRLGEGAFGVVYKGKLGNGLQVAVKQLKPGIGQVDREFQTEVGIISQANHRHVVSLVGYCMGQGQRILVFEFVPNKSLKSHLHGSGINWSRRVKVALGSAEGLAYLHEECRTKIIHRDIKPDNILLDNNWEPKIADFGIAKILPDGNTHIQVTRVIGTPGYVDPECVSTHQFTERSDAYSFGVMILELITGREAIFRTPLSMVKLVDWARPLMNPQSYRQLVDSRLKSIYNVNEMTRMVNCAAVCVGPSQSRPRMSKIVRFLEGHLSLNELK